jgi:hypothetical protein
MSHIASRGCRAATRIPGSQRFLPRATALIPSFVQVVSVELEVDASTSLIDPIFATLLTLPITTIGGDLLIWFTVSAHSSANLIPEFRLLLDGGLLESTGMLFVNTQSNSAAVFRRVAGVAAGAHTITAEFAKAPGTAAGSLILVQPVLLPNREHAHIVAAELPV